MTAPYILKPFQPEPSHGAAALLGELATFCIPYSVEQFSDDDYARADIACPESIRRSVPKRRAEFFYGRLCAQAALAQYDIRATGIGIGARREPLWPDGFLGSITHTRRLAAAVALPAGRCNGIGIDLEIASEGGTLAAMKEIIVSEAEVARLAASRGAFDLDLLMVIVFSAKESFFKAAYSAVRDYFNFDAVEVVEVDLVARSLTLVVRQNLCAQFRIGDRHTARFALLDDDHVLTAVCW